MQFLFTGRRMMEKFSEAEFAPHMEREAEHLRKLYADGVARQFWSRPDVPGAVGIVEADSLDDAKAKMGTLPLVEAGMLEMTVVPLMPYRGFMPRNG
jgi:uncharacterized protein YciI